MVYKKILVQGDKTDPNPHTHPCAELTDHDKALHDALGIVGEKGDKGDNGDQGIQGIAGQDGADGEDGAQGIKGDTGETGAQGIQGTQGAKGDKGDKGDAGETGAQGIQGDKGEIGTQGIQGEQGIQGIKGDTGETGVQGQQGIQGETGAQGIKGDKGDQGDAGTTLHSTLTDVTADQHHPQTHTLASHSTKAHNELTGVGADDHHAQAHTLASHSTKSHTELTDVGSNTHAQIDTHITLTMLGYTISVQALTSSPTDAQTIYFGKLPKAPVTTGGQSKIYIRKAGTIKIAEIYCYSGTAGTNEAWSLYIRKNNTTDTLIATINAATSERVFSNTGLSIAVAVGDYIEIKAVNPSWSTNPLTTIFGGYIYIE